MKVHCRVAHRIICPRKTWRRVSYRLREGMFGSMENKGLVSHGLHLPHSGVCGKVMYRYKCTANSGFCKGENFTVEEFWLGQKGNEAV